LSDLKKSDEKQDNRKTGDGFVHNDLLPATTKTEARDRRVAAIQFAGKLEALSDVAFEKGDSRHVGSADLARIIAQVRND
jgi:hypothetical protein